MNKEKKEDEKMNKINILSSPTISNVTGFNKEIEEPAIRAFPSAVKISGLSDDFINTENRVRAINDYSAGLSFAIPDTKILSDYAAAVKSQRIALDSIFQIGEKLKTENNQLFLEMDKTMSPIAYAIKGGNLSKDKFYGLDSIVDKFKIQNDQLVSFIDDAVLPISSAVADIGLTSVNAAKLLEGGLINENQFKIAQDLSGLALNTIQEHQKVIGKGLNIIGTSSALEWIDTISPSIKAVSSGFSEILQSLPTFPSITETSLADFKVTQDGPRLSEEESSELQDKLDKLLFDIDPELVEFRKGAWKVFNGKGRDYIGQSASSMRRLLDNLLRKLAPQEEVVKTNYFHTNSEAQDANGRPTRLAKIFYLVGWDKNKSKHLKRVVNGLLGLYDNLNAWDHAPLKKHNFVHGTFIAIEGHLLSILTVTKE